MIVVMEAGASQEEIDEVVNMVKQIGYDPRLIQGVERTVIACVGDERGKARLQALEALSGVERVVPILKPYKLASKAGAITSTVAVNHVNIGGTEVVIMAGPCSVESREQLMETAWAVKKAGAHILRGGAFKPRTSPYSFQGMGKEGLELLAEAREETGLPVVTEVMSPMDVELVATYADMLQIGTRNMQNFPLLKEVGRTKKPVLLKRGLMSTIEEFLMAAEYILSAGNPNVVLCERGIRTFETATRNTLDISSVPVIKQETHLPIIIDPSQASGHWQYISPLSRAAIAVGADGLIIEVHPKPEEALSDGAQSLKPEKFVDLMQGLLPFIEAAGRRVHASE